MGHDILGFNKAGKEIAYARFSMGNYNAIELYSLLNALPYYGGVSGIGRSSTYTKEQLAEAIKKYKAQFGEPETMLNSGTEHWDLKQIAEFLLNCAKTAEEEGTVEIYFG